MSRVRQRRKQQLNALEDELFALARAAHQLVARRDGRDLAVHFAGLLALGDIALPAGAAVALTFCAAVWPQLDDTDPALARWRDEMADRVPLVATLRAAPLGVWDVARPGGARPVLATPLAASAPEPERLNALMLPGGPEVRSAPATPVVGWRVERDVIRALVVLAPLDDPAARLAGADSAVSPLRLALDSAARRHAPDVLWPWTEPDTRTDTPTEPEPEPEPERPRLPTPSGPAAREIAGLHDEIAQLGRIFAQRPPGELTKRAELVVRVRAWLDRRPGTLLQPAGAGDAPRVQVWWREVVAVARRAADLTVLRDLVAAARDLQWVTLHHCAVDRDHFERALPVDEVIEAICGVRPDASMPSALDDDALRHAPCAALGLPADHPLFVGLDPGAPVHAALRWAEGRSGEAVERLEAALATLRAEQRWLATWLDGELLRTQPMLAWDHLAHALHHLFAPALRAAPIDVLDLAPRFAGRLHALGDTLGELPVTTLALRSHGTVGDKTQRALVEHLVAHMRTWRGPLRPTTTDMARADEVRSGLDTLASLFGDDFQS